MKSRWLGDYEILRRLRVGGMATLYLARRHGASGFSRQVVLKAIHSHLLDQPRFLEMFVDEARICSQITHPNIVHVEELGEIDGMPFLVMEFIDGCSANDLLAYLRKTDRKLPPELAAHIVMTVAKGLHAAHEAVDADGKRLEIIHRDITPSNILLSTDGHIKLIDFGIAKARNRLSETESGFALKGKYRYVAPEQATGRVDRRTDIFSLGVVFWELLTREQLFADDTHVALFNRLHETLVQPPSSIDPTLPEALDAIVMNMLQHAAIDRPSTAQEVQRAIATAMPEAMTADTEVLARLAVEVRDARVSARAGTEDRMGTEPSFAPVRRAKTTSAQPAPGDSRIEVIPPLEKSDRIARPSGSMPVATSPTSPVSTSASNIEESEDLAIVIEPATTVSPSRAPSIRDEPPPRTSPRRTRAFALLGAGVVALGLILFFAFGREKRTEDAATPPPRTQTPSASDRADPPAPAVANPEPTTPTTPTEVAPPEPAKPPPVAAAVAATGAATPPPVTRTPTARAPAAPITRAITAAPVRPPNAVAVRPAPAVRAPKTVTVQATPEPPKAVAPARSTIKRGNATFVDSSFDDAGNTTTAKSRAPTRTTVKKTTIVTDFGD